MTPLEKVTFKSGFQDEEFIWQQLLITNQKLQNEKVDKIAFSDPSKFFMIQNTKKLMGFFLNVSYNSLC